MTQLLKRRMLWTIPLVILLVPIVGLAALSLLSQPPKNLGVKDGRLLDCPPSPNCVCTQASDARHQMAPIPFDGTSGEALKRLEAAIATLPGTKIVDRSENYLYAESTSRIFRFVDDIELFVDAEHHVIHYRSASRAGRSDLGVNKKRMQALREAFEASR
jgi:uncharacterized protein (DUF1499 family)